MNVPLFCICCLLSARALFLPLVGPGRGGVARKSHGLPKQRRTCNEMKQRRFSFQDAACGADALNFTVEDTLQAYRVEQAYWNGVGKDDPWWAVLKQYHHDTIPKAVKLAFYQTGLEWLNNMIQLAKHHGLSNFLQHFRNGTALDLGCGLGRMGNALAYIGFTKVICVDHSPYFLRRASRELEKIAEQGVITPGIANKMQFIQSGPDLLCSVLPGTVDFSHSVITLQHMKPMLQVAYVEQLCDVLRPGGFGYFQIPVHLNASHQQHCNVSSETFGMAMHYTPTAEITRHLRERGCKVLMAADSDLFHGIGAAGKSKSIAFQKQ